MDAGEIHDGSEAGSDLRSLAEKLPLVAVTQDMAHYFDWHHTAADTFDDTIDRSTSRSMRPRPRWWRTAWPTSPRRCPSAPRPSPSKQDLPACDPARDSACGAAVPLTYQNVCCAGSQAPLVMRRGGLWLVTSDRRAGGPGLAIERVGWRARGRAQPYQRAGRAAPCLGVKDGVRRIDEERLLQRQRVGAAGRQVLVVILAAGAAERRVAGRAGGE